MTPLLKPMIAVSAIKTLRMSRLRAPIARRIPISRIRSMTEFDVITPIMTVDTTSEMDATAMSIADTRSIIMVML